MSKPLSEQVAELEATNDALWRDINDMRRERDRLKAENVELWDSRKRWHDKFLEAMRERNALEADNEDLRAGQGTWPEGDDDFPCCSGDRAKLQAEVDQLSDALRLASREKDEWEANYTELANSTPRVISADELRVGQRVAVELNSGWFAGDVTGINRVISNGCESTGPAKGLTDCTIVLLADAPGPERDAAPRLTVHALNTAPVGSWLNRAGISLPRLIKQPDGLWAVSITHVGLSSEFALSEWPDATLTHPERGDDE